MRAALQHPTACARGATFIGLLLETTGSDAPVLLTAGSAYLLALVPWLAPRLQPVRLQAHA
ncbi:hypothetical protein KHA79_19400 [Xanthomonas translucens pv. cerealis]|nr:hypothetical protein KHA79_19400 [Xanthomonas translucens pv. cerealis]